MNELSNVAEFSMLAPIREILSSCTLSQKRPSGNVTESNLSINLNPKNEQVISQVLKMMPQLFNLYFGIEKEPSLAPEFKF